MEADLADEAQDNVEDEKPKHQQLPDDLPTSLDDRRKTTIREAVEIYDAWQGR